MLEEKPDPVVLKYYLYRAVGGPGFIYPIYVLYLLSHGLSYAAIGTIGAIQSAIVVVGEMPTGYVGDRVGRRNSLLIGQLLYAASALGMILGEGFLAFAAAFSLLSFGQTFVSGSGDAWLYDSLEEKLDEDRFTHVRGRGGAIGQWITAATMVLGGGLYVLGHVYPFVALLAMRLVTFGVVLTMPKNAQYADAPTGSADGEADSDDADDDPPASGANLTVVDALPIIRNQLSAPPLRAFVAYMALFLGVATTVDAFIQPITVDALRDSLLTTFRVPEAVALGFLYASFTAASAVASDRASDLERLLGLRTAVLVVPGVITLLLIVPAVVPVLAFPMFFVLKGGQSVLRPITGQYINDNVESVGRATVLSAVAMVYAAARIPFAIGSGVVADLFSPLVAVAALGGAFLVGGTVAWLLWPPVPKTYDDPAPDGVPSSQD